MLRIQPYGVASQWYKSINLLKVLVIQHYSFTDKTIDLHYIVIRITCEIYYESIKLINETANLINTIDVSYALIISFNSNIFVYCYEFHNHHPYPILD